MRHVALVIALLLLPSAAGAQPAAAPGPTRKVALAPVATFGEETKSKQLKIIEKAIGDGLGSVPGIELIDAERVSAEIKKSKKIELRVCDGEAACLAELGQLVGAAEVVFAEVGGLGESQVAYLKLVDVGKKAEVRSTTMEIAAVAELKAAARGASFRLLDPDKYVGRLVCKVDVDGATIYVNGARSAKSPARPISLPVGTHALRIAHPEFRDFVRFVDISFDKDAVVEAPMQQFPIVSRDIIHKEGTGGTKVIYQGVEPTPWYRQWYTVAGGGALLLVGSAVLFGVLADGLDFDGEKVVDGL
jgi:hypothetical protein